MREAHSWYGRLETPCFSFILLWTSKTRAQRLDILIFPVRSLDTGVLHTLTGVAQPVTVRLSSAILLHCRLSSTEGVAGLASHPTLCSMRDLYAGQLTSQTLPYCSVEKGLEYFLPCTARLGMLPSLYSQAKTRMKANCHNTPSSGIVERSF